MAGVEHLASSRRLMDWNTDARHGPEGSSGDHFGAVANELRTIQFVQ